MIVYTYKYLEKAEKRGKTQQWQRRERQYGRPSAAASAASLPPVIHASHANEVDSVNRTASASIIQHSTVAATHPRKERARTALTPTGDPRPAATSFRRAGSGPVCCTLCISVITGNVHHKRRAKGRRGASSGAVVARYVKSARKRVRARVARSLDAGSRTEC